MQPLSSTCKHKKSSAHPGTTTMFVALYGLPIRNLGVHACYTRACTRVPCVHTGSTHRGIMLVAGPSMSTMLHQIKIHHDFSLCF